MTGALTGHLIHSIGLAMVQLKFLYILLSLLCSSQQKDGRRSKESDITACLLPVRNYNNP